MDDVLARLRAFVDANPYRAFFAPPATASAIDAVERHLGMPLPPSYREFLLTYDGGFINLCDGRPDDPNWNEAGERWNSNWLYGADDLIRKYDAARGISGWDRLQWFPFCQTFGQEYLAFIPDDDPESPVFDACLEMDEWDVLYSDFPTFLAAYVEGEGNVKTIASD